MPDAILFTSQKVTVEHLGLDSGSTTKEGYVTDAALSGANSPDVNIQPSSAQVIALYGGAPGKTYTMFTTSSGILETDRLTLSGSTQQFIVKGRMNYNYDVGQHLEYVLEEIL